MSIIKLFESFDTGAKTEEEKDTYMSRKDAFRKLGNITKKTALASLPLAAFTAMPKMAFAKKRDAVDVLNFALTLEHLEYRFYQMGIDSGVIAAEDQAVFNVIRDHELAHVQLLQETINALGGTPVEEPNFDFTAGGTFPDPFTNYPIFMALSQGFEDTGVRAYKGQAGNIMENDDLLTVALQIHSVEARHASQVRRMRDRKGWITEPDYDGIEGFEDATAGIYAGEENVTHLGVDATTTTEVDALGVQEAYDEPLSQEAVLNIASPFIVQ
jgi:rubrerythrin